MCWNFHSSLKNVRLGLRTLVYGTIYYVLFLFFFILPHIRKHQVAIKTWDSSENIEESLCRAIRQ